MCLGTSHLHDCARLAFGGRSPATSKRILVASSRNASVFSGFLKTLHASLSRRICSAEFAGALRSDCHRIDSLPMLGVSPPASPSGKPLAPGSSRRILACLLAPIRNVNLYGSAQCELWRLAGNLAIDGKGRTCFVGLMRVGSYFTPDQSLVRRLDHRRSTMAVEG